MARGGKRVGAGRKTISRVQRLLIAAHVETELKSGTVAVDTKEMLAVRRHQSYLQRISVMQRRHLPFAAREHLRWINQQLRDRRIGVLYRPSSREIMQQAARDATDALGVTVTWQQVRRWLTAYRKTKL